MPTLAIILFSILCSSSAHVALKQGAALATKTTFSLAGLMGLATNAWLVGGMVLHGVALVAWVVALARVPLSAAYPFVALGFVLTELLAHYVLHEASNPLRTLGLSVIVIGVLIVARSWP